MWDQPTEPTLVGAPVGHPDGSFSVSNAIWGGGGGNTGASSSAVPPNAGRPVVGNPGGKMENWGMPMKGGGGGNQQQQQQPWNANNGPSPVKNTGWDQQPSSAVNAPNNGSSSWNPSQNAQQSSQPINWNNNPSASQWESTSPTGPSSWSQVASKNVPQQQQLPAVRPKTSYDPGTSNWGAGAVDQGTPWGSAAAAAEANAAKSNEWNNSNGTASWENNPPPPPPPPQQQQPTKDNNNSSWHHGGQQQQQKEKPMVNDGGAGAYWKPNGVVMNEQQRRPIHSQQNQWNHEPVASGTGWDSVPPAMNRNWNSEVSTPSNVWTGPPSAQDSAVDSSMIWNNPNPKKVIQPDKGTNVWGDPQGQNEIRRWKISGEDVSTAAASGQQTPQMVNPGGGQQGATPAQTPGGSSVWKDSPIAPLSQKMPPGNWNDSSATTPPNVNNNPTDATMTNGTALWDAGGVKGSASLTAPWGNDNNWAGNKPNLPPPLLNKSMSWTGQPPQSLLHKNGFVGNNSVVTPTVTNASHFLNISPSLSQSQNDIGQRNSGNSDGDSVPDDVFSPNPPTPTAHLKNGISNNMFTPVGDNMQQQQQGGNKALSQQAGNQSMVNILTKRLADRVNLAIQAGFIDPVILNHSLPPEAIVRLNQLLQYISKLDQAQRDYQALTNGLQQQRQQQSSQTQSQDLQRLSNDIRQYQAAIQTIKGQISAHASMLNKNRSPPNMSTSSSGGQNNADSLSTSTGNGGNESLSTNQSKLMRWKTGNDNGEDGDKKSPSAINLENLVQNVALNGESNDLWTKKSNNLGSDWPQQNDISSKSDSSAKNDKSPNENQSFTKDGSNGPASSNSDDGNGGGLLNDSNSAVDSSTKSSTACVTPTNVLDEVPEFRPGQKFMWRDPKEVADDPNATPGSIKTNALTLNTNLNLNPSQHGGSSNVLGVNFFGQQPSSLFGGSSSASLTKTNSFDFSRPSIPFNSSDSFLAARAGPAGNNYGRMPSASQMGQQQLGGRPPIIKQQYSVPNSFVPYNNMGQWIVLNITNNMGQIDEHTLQMLVNRIGTTQSYVSPPGSGVAFVKFRDVPLERVFPRMQQEFSPLGVTVQLMKDSEVERVLQPYNNIQRQPPAAAMFGGGGGHGGGGPPPSGPHGMMWDAPPPGPWGGMPGAAPMPHHQFMPPDHMPQMMQQPPQMHDNGGGLFGGPPDRHPF